MSHVHSYTATLRWSGSTGDGYERYSRTHTIGSPPARAWLDLSGDASFGGNPDLMNPEQLLVMAASSCQLLSFLAIAARARIDVVSYEDAATGVMPEDDPPMRITRIELRPKIVVAGGAEPERIQHYVELAHKECFIANSLKTEITIDPEIEIRA